MSTLRAIKRRIKSIQSVAKVTRAMEIIAASKMRKLQARALASRPYDYKIRQVIADLVAAQPPSNSELHPLMVRRPVSRIALIHLTTDRGLCGGLNSQLNQSVASFIAQRLEKGIPVTVIAVGKKGRDFMWRTKQNIRAEFSGIKDEPSILDVTPIARIVIEDFTAGFVDEVYISYPRFISTMVQKPTIERLLPVEPASFPKGQNVEYIFEPDPASVLNALLPRFVEMEIYHALLETKASEQSARMVAMRNATENAKELTQELTLFFNKVRQETITKEILDLVGAQAVQG